MFGSREAQIQTLSRVSPCPGAVQFLSGENWWNTQFGSRGAEIQTVSRVCPCPEVVQTLSSGNYFFESWRCEPWWWFSGSKVSPEFVQWGKMWFPQFVGQCLYKLWMPMSKPCPGRVKMCWGLTDCRPGLVMGWTYPVLFGSWTEPGQSLDEALTEIGFLSRPCPTKHRKRVPSIVVILSFRISVCVSTF